MRSYLFAVLVGCLLVAGCVNVGKRAGEQNVAIYDFGKLPAALVGDANRSMAYGIEIRSPRWLDSAAINYRLGYDKGSRRNEYTLSRWVATPAQLIDHRLRYQLGLASPGQSGVRCVLVVEIDEFLQLFTSTTESAGVLQGNVRLLDRSRNGLSSWRFDFDVPAVTPDASGGAAALIVAVDHLGKAIFNWMDTADGRAARSSCAN